MKLSNNGPLYSNALLYGCYVGKLNLLTYTRPDIAFVVWSLSQFMHSLEILMFELSFTLVDKVFCLLLKATNEFSSFQGL